MDYLRDGYRRMKKLWVKGRGSDLLLLWFYAFFAYLAVQFFHTATSIVFLIDHVVSHPEAVFFGTSLIYLIGLLFWAVFNHFDVAKYSIIGLSLGVGLVSAIKLIYRGEPLYPSDLAMVSQLPTLVRMVDMKYIFAAGIGVGVFIGVLRRVRRRKGQTLHRKMRLLIGVLASLLIFSVFYSRNTLFTAMAGRYFEWMPHSQSVNYSVNGFAAGFLYNMGSEPMADKHALSQEEAEQIFDKYQAVADTINEERTSAQVDANVIYVMNESLMDPLLLPESEASFDPLESIRKAKQLHTGGHMLSQGYGGGTANIEFEALTGISMEPFSPGISSPFTQFLHTHESFPSIVSRLKADGHHTTAIHPFTTEMYRRVENYDILGFDDFYYDENMKYTEQVGHFISDASVYKELMYRIRESEGYDFVHVVTMQNHSPHEDKYANVPDESDTGYASAMVNQYYRDLEHSNAAFQYLYEEVMAYEEPTVVVFWGDHWPWVFDDSKENPDELVRYITPSLIFSNFESEADDWDVISPVHFMNGVWDITDTKVSPYDALLYELYGVLPAFEKGYYLSADSDGFVQERSELSKDVLDVLSDYDQVVYDMTTGNKYLEVLGFFSVQ